MNEIQAYVGLDVHKDTISVAVAEVGREAEVRSWGAIPNETAAINRLVKRLHKKFGTFECVYEAGMWIRFAASFGGAGCGVPDCCAIEGSCPTGTQAQKERYARCA